MPLFVIPGGLCWPLQMFENVSCLLGRVLRFEKFSCLLSEILSVLDQSYLALSLEFALTKL